MDRKNKEDGKDNDAEEDEQLKMCMVDLDEAERLNKSNPTSAK